MRIDHNVFRLICNYLDNYDIFLLQFCSKRFNYLVQKYNGKINVYNLCTDIYFKISYNLHNRSLLDQFLAITIVKNYFNICKWLFKRGAKINITNHIHIKLCAEYGRLKFCKFFMPRMPHLNKEQLMSIAAQNSSKKICKWLLLNYGGINLCYDRGELLYNVAKSGSLKLLKKVFRYHRKTIAYKYMALMGAIAGGDIIMCKWLVNNIGINFKEKRYAVLLECAANGRYEIFLWLSTFKLPILKNIDSLFISAASSGNLNLCKELVKYNPQSIYDAFKTAVSCGHINICEWLLLYGITINQSIIMLSVEYNKFEMCKWLINIAADIKIDYNYLFSAAIICDNVEMCKWIIKYFECEIIIDKSLTNAVINGSLNICKWIAQIEVAAHETGFDNCLLYHAVSNGHLHICKWLLRQYRNNINLNFDNNQLFKTAAQYGFIDICYWIAAQKSVPHNIIKKYAPQLINLL